MSSPSPQAKPAKPKKRPGSHRHPSSTDWISKLHRRHDAKHHPESQEEQRPLLADDHPTEASDTEAQTQPPRQERFKALREALLKVKNAAKSGVLKVRDGAKKAGAVVSNGLKKSARTGRRHSKKIVAVALVLLTASTVTLGVLYYKHLQKDESNQVCTTPACVNAAFDILHNLHPSVKVRGKTASNYAEALAVDPCSNFDEFVCGGFAVNHQLRAEQNEVSAVTYIVDKIDRVLHRVLEQPVSKFRGDDRKIFEMFKTDYSACMDEQTIIQLGLKPLQNMTKHIQTLLPTINPSTARPHSQQLSIDRPNGRKGVLTDVFAYMIKTGVNALIRFDIRIDNKHSDRHVLFATPVVNIGLPAKQYYNDVAMVQRYQSIVQLTLAKFYNTNVNTSMLLHHRPGVLVTVADLAHGVVQLEIQLAQSLRNREELTDGSKTYNKISVSAFDNILPQISLRSLLTTFAPKNVTCSSVVVADLEYLHHVAYIVQATPREVLQAFFVWKAIQAYSQFVSRHLLSDLHDFEAKFNGIRHIYPDNRWQRCIRSAKEDLDWIASKFYLDKRFSRSLAEIAKVTMQNIKSSFIDILRTNKWMSIADRQRMLKKARAMKQYIGHSGHNPNMMDSGALRKFYHGVEIKCHAFFDNKVELAEFRTRHLWSRLGSSNQTRDWGYSAIKAHAQYDHTKNKLTIPAPLLERPLLYGDSVPAYISYGSLGALVGHEMSHAFGIAGTKYGPDGNYTDRLGNKTRKAFHDKGKCFVNQYGKYYIKTPSGTEHINGNLTLHENIADTSGVYAAYQAWKKLGKKNSGSHLPGLQQFTNDQLFWLSYGSSLCSKQTKEAIQRHLYTDVYAPKPIRILGTVSNSKGFREAFKCPVKKPTCEMW